MQDEGSPDSFRSEGEVEGRLPLPSSALANSSFRGSVSTFDFKTAGDDAWLMVLVDGEESGSKRIIFKNTSNKVLRIRVEYRGGFWDEAEIKGENSVILEGELLKLLVRGAIGGGGYFTVDRDSESIRRTAASVLIKQSGIAYYNHEPRECKKFILRNFGPGGLKVTVARVAPDGSFEAEVQPGTALPISCRIQQVLIEANDDTRSWLEGGTV